MHGGGCRGHRHRAGVAATAKHPLPAAFYCTTCSVQVLMRHSWRYVAPGEDPPTSQQGCRPLPAAHAPRMGCHPGMPLSGTGSSRTSSAVYRSCLISSWNPRSARLLWEPGLRAAPPPPYKSLLLPPLQPFHSTFLERCSPGPQPPCQVCAHLPTPAPPPLRPLQFAQGAPTVVLYL